MLVLSRRTEEKIIFPGTGITVQVLGIKGNVVKVGVEAPPEIRIIRDELNTNAGGQPEGSSSRQHTLLNQLNKLSLYLDLMQRQWESGKQTDAQGSLAKAMDLLENLDRDWNPIRIKETRELENRAPRTLLVEDDQNERELLAGILTLQGCACDTVSDGEDALNYLASHDRPDFILLDMVMPRCDGRTTLERIRKDPRTRDLKVFAVSGTPPENLGILTGPEGINAWFRKPLNPGKMWNEIQRLLAV